MGIEVTRDEADKRAAAGLDMLEVRNKDPKYHYRWLRKEKLNMARKTGLLGYEVVQGSGEESILGESTRIKKGEGVDSTVEVGDLVLARIPKEEFDAHRAAHSDKVRRRTRGVVQSYKNQIRRASGDDLAYEEHRASGNMRED